MRQTELSIVNLCQFLKELHLLFILKLRLPIGYSVICKCFRIIKVTRINLRQSNFRLHNKWRICQKCIKLYEPICTTSATFALDRENRGLLDPFFILYSAPVLKWKAPYQNRKISLRLDFIRGSRNFFEYFRWRTKAFLKAYVQK